MRFYKQWWLQTNLQCEWYYWNSATLHVHHCTNFLNNFFLYLSLWWVKKKTELWKTLWKVFTPSVHWQAPVSFHCIIMNADNAWKLKPLNAWLFLLPSHVDSHQLCFISAAELILWPGHSSGTAPPHDEYDSVTETAHVLLAAQDQFQTSWSSVLFNLP